MAVSLKVVSCFHFILLTNIHNVNTGWAKLNKFVRPPRWPYDMRPSARAEKYIRDGGP